MKRKRILYLIAVLFISLIFYGCEKKITPEEVFGQYMNSWQNHDFTSMYSLISNESRQRIGEQEFTQRYSNIYKGIEAGKLTVTVENRKGIKPDKDGIVSIPFNVSLDTVAGQISFSYKAELKQELIEKKKIWRIQWDSRMIFPDLGDQEKVRVSKLAARRGEIRDRSGNAIAMNGTAAEIGIVPGKLGAGPAGAKGKIAQILGVTVEQIDKKLSASYVKPDMFIPIKVIPEDENEKINGLLKIPGVMVNHKKTRVYPLKDKAAHLTGYIQTLNTEELEKLKGEGYSNEDVIGKAGLEKIYEKTLRAKNGVEIYILDKDGKRKSTLAVKKPEDGQDIRLTIDSDIQSVLYDELKEDAGTGVALHPKTGEVLALVSTPAYNPNSFVLGMSEREWKGLNENPKKPLSNRFQSNFVPGSVFKPVTAAIALKTNKLDKEAVKTTQGLKWQKGKSWGNYSVTRVSEYSGPCNLLNALLHSDNIYFAQVALDIGKDLFLSEVKSFGIGEKIPFEYGMAASQFDQDGAVESEIQLADSGYGQGEILINPLHIASIYSSFVNEGNMIQPHLEREEENTPEVWKKNVFSPEIADLLLNNLTQVVQNPEGSGHQAYIPGLPLAGKTGTAEIKRVQGDTNGTELGWFAAVNTENPRLLVVAMVEDVKNRGGSHYVVPKVRKVFEQGLK